MLKILQKINEYLNADIEVRFRKHYSRPTKKHKVKKGKGSYKRKKLIKEGLDNE